MDLPYTEKRCRSEPAQARDTYSRVQTGTEHGAPGCLAAVEAWCPPLRPCCVTGCTEDCQPGKPAHTSHVQSSYGRSITNCLCVTFCHQPLLELKLIPAVSSSSGGRPDVVWPKAPPSVMFLDCRWSQSADPQTDGHSCQAG